MSGHSKWNNIKRNFSICLKKTEQNKNRQEGNIQNIVRQNKQNLKKADKQAVFPKEKAHIYYFMQKKCRKYMAVTDGKKVVTFVFNILHIKRN